MEDKNKGFKEQNIVIQNREKAVVTGVEDILSFDDELVIVPNRFRTFNYKRRESKDE